MNKPTTIRALKEAQTNVLQTNSLQTNSITQQQITENRQLCKDNEHLNCMNIAKRMRWNIENRQPKPSDGTQNENLCGDLDSIIAYIAATLESERATRVSDEDIEEYIEYLRADAEQYGQWGKVGRRDGYNKEADRMQAILTLRKEGNDDE